MGKDRHGKTGEGKLTWLQWIVGGLLFACVAVGFAAHYGAIEGVTGPSVTLVLFAIAGLAAVAFWRQLWKVIENREVSITKEGIKLGCPTPEGISPSDIGSDRDRWLFFGIDQMSKGHQEEALYCFSRAYDMKPSILAAFRCMQCSAVLNRVDTKDWYYEALLLGEKAPLSELAGRGRFREWVLQHRGDEAEALVKAAQDIDF